MFREYKHPIRRGLGSMGELCLHSPCSLKCKADERKGLVEIHPSLLVRVKGTGVPGGRKVKFRVLGFDFAASASLP